MVLNVIIVHLPNVSYYWLNIKLMKMIYKIPNLIFVPTKNAIPSMLK